MSGSFDRGAGLSLRNRRVLVTGHTGFTGGWLVRWLYRLGAQVYGYSLAPDRNPSLFEVLESMDFMNSSIGDICDTASLEEVFCKVDPEYVFHLAAQPIVRESFVNPEETFRSNVMGTVSVLTRCLKAPSLRGVVCVTSDKVYRNNEWIWPYRECDPLGGKDPYSASKSCCELVVDSFRSSYIINGDAEFRIDSARGGNIVGGGDWAVDRIVPDLVRAITSGQKMRIRYPQATRPWQHVLSLVSGYLELADQCFSNGRESFGEAWNFGPEQGGRSVEDLVDGIVSHWKRPDISFDDPEFVEATRLDVDISKASRELGWSPVLGFEQVCEWTAEWYMAYYNDPTSISALMDAQIEKFVDLRGIERK